MYFELLQVALGSRESLSHIPSAKEWEEMKVLCMKHAVPGVGFYAMRKLSENGAACVPPREIIMELYAQERNMALANVQQTEDVMKLTWLFEQEGFCSCLLKGCGLARMYPEGMQRMSGDIDIWVVPKGKESEPLHRRRREVLELCRRVVGRRDVFYHHTDLPLKGKEIEVHFTPSWMFAPWHNRRLQRFFQEEWKNRRFVRVQEGVANAETMTEGYYVPSLEMNAVYVLLHIYRHVFAEGVGLRQVVDYFYVLHQKGWDRDRVISVLKSLKMLRFAGAVMYVLQKVFGMDDKYLLLPPDEKEGRFLLNEIMLAGNFGHHDKRIKRVANESALHVFLRRTIRNLRFIRSYPSEVLWAPLFKIWHYFMRMKWNGGK